MNFKYMPANVSPAADFHLLLHTHVDTGMTSLGLGSAGVETVY